MSSSVSSTSAPLGYRLPGTLVPLRYKLQLQVDPSLDTFSGRVRILLRGNPPKGGADGTTSDALSQIVCNIDPELTVSHAQVFVLPTLPPGKAATADFDSVTQQDRRVVDVGATRVDIEHQLLIIDLLQPISLNAAMQERVLVDLVFQGTLNREMLGLYRSQTKDLDGNNVNMLVTQFESVSARRCFPCWDEPALKAIFSIELITPAPYVVLSNTDEVTRFNAHNSSWIVHQFADTPPMSTYLVAFVVGDMESIEATAPVSGIRMRCWTRRGMSWSAQFALDVACKAMDFYTDWFGLAYPLGKCDLIAIPDFEAGFVQHTGTHRVDVCYCFSHAMFSA